MLIHDLYPVPLEARVEEALASVRPYMESHGGDVELLRLEDGVAHLRLVGHCHGCPASAATLELAIKEALEEAAPDLLGLEVEGVAEAKPLRKPLTVITPAEAPAGPGLATARRGGRGRAGDVPRTRARGRRPRRRERRRQRPRLPRRCAACDAALGDAIAGRAAPDVRSLRLRVRPAARRGAAAGEAQLAPVPLLRRDGQAYEVALA